jgi:hypothetical protein
LRDAVTDSLSSMYTVQEVVARLLRYSES